MYMYVDLTCYINSSVELGLANSIISPTRQDSNHNRTSSDKMTQLPYYMYRHNRSKYPIINGHFELKYVGS